MSIYLNGSKVPGFNQKIAVHLNLAGEDMSGQGSHTPQAETGDKPKEMSVSLEIRFIDAAELTRLLALAEAKNGSDERMIYNIINQTAQTMNIRQVRFQGSLQVRENEDLALWMVSFNLIEYSSVAEKKQARAKGMTVGTQAPTGTAIASTSSTDSGLSVFEQVIKKASAILR